MGNCVKNFTKINTNAQKNQGMIAKKITTCMTSSKKVQEKCFHEYEHDCKFILISYKRSINK